MAEGQPGPGGPGRAEFGLGPGGALAGETPACLVLGNFDGVHLGHQAILARARVVAQAREAEVVAITFQPHPRTVIQPGQGPPLISPPELRRRLLVEHRVDRVWVLPFTPRLRQLTPGEFMDRVRVRLRLVAMVVGPRVSLGRGGEGGMDFLAAYAEAVGLELVVVDALVRAGRDLSSSWIRSELELGDLEQVAGMLGRPFDVLGRIERGQGLGRQLGFPTANLELHPEQALPPDGVYVMTARLDGGPELGAVGS
ncbi:MAG: riboflavin kinase, partial [Candidatus Dormibacteria bacterium]